MGQTEAGGCLGNGSYGSNRGSARSNSVHVDVGGDLSSSLLLGAVARDVASLTTAVASLASSVKRAAVGSSAVAGDVAELAAGVALHGLSLAITGKMVGATALVAGSRARTAGEATAGEASVAATTHRGTAAHGTRANGVGASASEMTRLAAVIATTACGVAAQAEGRAVGLDVAKTLAVVALLGLGGARKRAAIRLVAGLFA